MNVDFDKNRLPVPAKPIARIGQGRRRGVELVEAALIMPILLVFLFGVCDFGWNLFERSQIDNATRDGVRRAALDDSPTLVDSRIETEAMTNPKITDDQITLQTSTDGGSTWSALGTSATDSTKNNATSGNLIRATVTYNYRSITSFFSFFNNTKVQSVVTIRHE